MTTDLFHRPVFTEIFPTLRNSHFKWMLFRCLKFSKDKCVPFALSRILSGEKSSMLKEHSVASKQTGLGTKDLYSGSVTSKPVHDCDRTSTF